MSLRQGERNPPVVGLTGGIGVGKTTAALILAEFGAVIVDCDQLGRDVVEVGGGAYDALVARFGPSVVGDDRSLDRAALGAIVFNDADALADLNAITHPAIDAEIDKRLAAVAPGVRVVLDMAVLVESELGAGRYHEVLVIEAPLDARLARLEENRSMSAEDVKARIASQASDEDRRAVANHVITNDGDVDTLRASLRSWWNG